MLWAPITQTEASMTDRVWSQLQRERSAWPGSVPLGSMGEIKLVF